jgi:hypothetical protein
MTRLRDEAEIVRAHDLLVAILTETPAIEMSDEVRLGMKAAADVLCWALHHDHNDNFATNLQTLEDELAKYGGGMVRRPN